jgi:hypothetical protein
MSPRMTCACFAMILALAVAPVLAQQDQHPPGTTAGLAGAPQSSMMQAMPGCTPMMRMMIGQEGMDGMAMMHAAMTEHIEGRLAFLKTELKITNAQLPLWDNFAQAVRDNAKAMGGMMQGSMAGMKPSMALPDKLAMREKMMAAHLEALKKLKAVIDPLYAAFTDEQKKAADELMLSPMGA